MLRPILLVVLFPGRVTLVIVVRVRRTCAAGGLYPRSLVFEGLAVARGRLPVDRGHLIPVFRGFLGRRSFRSCHEPLTSVRLPALEKDRVGPANSFDRFACGFVPLAWPRKQRACERELKRLSAAA